MISEKVVNTGLPPCTLSEVPDGILVGTYELDKSTGSRSGSLDIYNPELDLLHSVPVSSAVLDTKVVDDRIFVASSTGDILIYDSHLQLVDKINVSTALVTQLAIRGNILAATITSGDLVVQDLESGCKTFESRIHDLEAWTLAFGSQNTVFTGGDDRQLSCTDLRIPYTLWKVKPHEAGVTSILPRANQEVLWTGGYDDCINIFDLRGRRVMDTCNLGGGVWRLVENVKSSRVLACCMYGGLRTLDSHDFGQVVSSLTNHESMVYGGLWLSDTQGVTCSFYDRMLQKWSL